MAEIFYLEDIDYKLLETGFDKMSPYEQNNLIVKIGSQKKLEYTDITHAVILQYHKDIKLQVLADECEERIIGGFKSKLNGHIYRINRDDQSNMMGQKIYLDAHTDVKEVQWKVEDIGYIKHTREEWIAVFFEGFEYKQSILFEYNNMKLKILSATTHADIVPVKWSENPQTVKIEAEAEIE